MVMTVEEKKAKANAASAKWRANNKEKMSLSRAKWRANNKEKIANDMKVYYNNNKEKCFLNMSKWRSNNKEKVCLHKLTSARKNSATYNAASARYRARKFGATIYMTKEDKAKIDELYTIADNATKLFGYAWAVDHIVPLNKGGLHKLSNLQVVPATWNSAKKDRNCDTYWD